MADVKPQRTVLIIDDDRLFCDATAAYLEDRDLKVLSAHTRAEALDSCARQQVDVILLDQKLPDGEGAELCPSLLDFNDQAKIIFITAYPSLETALKAIRVGAFNYLSKPIEMDALDVALDQALRTLELEQVAQVQRYKAQRKNKASVLIGEDDGLKTIRRHIALAADSRATVFLRGETGTGKGIVARTIHSRGTAPESAYISINCAALPEHLMEAELFGYEKGAFTGATNANKGLFEVADGGTLFLDEIGELPPALQSKLLGVLDDNAIRRLGGRSQRLVDVRIIAATNVDLPSAIAEKRFREDLYYRLGVIEITLPPLRERLSDLPALCAHFIKSFAPEGNLKLPEGEIDRLRRYAWPGNIRELRNVIERAVILREGLTIRPSRLLPGSPSDTGERAPDIAGDMPLMALKDMERQYIRDVLEKLDNNHSRTARTLGISRSTLMRKIAAYGL